MEKNKRDERTEPVSEPPARGDEAEPGQLKDLAP